MLRLPLSLSLALLFAACDGSNTTPDDKDKDPDDTGEVVGGDEDGDGFRPSEGDCDDNNSEVYPTAEEACNGLDDNCDGAVDEGVDGTFYQDFDGDGFGDESVSVVACVAPSGYVESGTDCDDSEPDSYPGGVEVCDEIDNNCDGAVDEGVTGSWFADADGDGFGDSDALTEGCDQPEDSVEEGGDCDDTTDNAYPGNAEVCDEVDNNCDGTVDEGTTTTYYADFDGDAYGAADLTQEACAVPTGYTINHDDCDDGDRAVNPSATEVCNTIDDNCDTVIDSDAADRLTWYADTDGDTYGDTSAPLLYCDPPPSGYVADATDCDDARALTNPGAAEFCNTYDDDCDGTVDEASSGDSATWYLDADGDSFGNASISQVSCVQPTGYVADATDCNDGTARANPDAVETCDTIDNNCDGAIDEDTAADATTWYADADADTYGNPAVTDRECYVPSGYVANATDCDDARTATYPGAPEYCNTYDDDCDGTVDEASAVDARTWYADADADAYGNSAVTVVECYVPSGYVANATDCDDGRALTNPAATEFCNSYDDDCDGTVDEDSASGAATWYRDADSDTYGDPTTTDVSCSAPSGYVADNTDCLDTSAISHPGADEICDRLDNDCDGTTDEDSAVDATTWYADADRDTYGNPAVTDRECYVPSGYVANATDCDDGRAASYPGAPEYCNTYDDDCDGAVDEDSALDVRTWYADADADAYGNPSVSDRECYVPSGYVANATDCDDGRALTNPGATEYCNSIDDDCDGTIDEDSASGAVTWYRDADSDTYGDPSTSDVSCTAPSGYVINNTDCLDTSAISHPGAPEICDRLDNDCDGTTDEDSAVDATTWYRDADADSYGNAAVTDRECYVPSGYVANSTDCLDTRAASYPGAPEYCNTYDDDCDGTVDEDSALDVVTWYRDADADSYGNLSVTDRECTVPSGYVANSTDCDDARALTNPGATEYCNSVDDDCDGTIDENAAADAITWYRDADSDAYGNPSVSSVSCTAPSGYILNNTDCLDTSAISYPGANEICDSLDNDCDGTVDDSPIDGTTYYADSDTDGFGDPSSTTSQCSLPSGYAVNDYDCLDTDRSEPVVADPVSGSGSGAGTLASPFDSLQDAIDNANECVVAYGGTYLEQIDLDGKSIDVWGVEGQDITTIDANLSTCTTANPTACGATVTVNSNTNSTPTIHGFTITGGTGAYSRSTATTTCADSSASHNGRNTCSVTTYEYCGGGVYAYGDDPTFYDVIIRDNTLPGFEQTSVGGFTQTWMYSFGGAVCLQSSNASFSTSIIEGNFADQGGGIFAESSSNLAFQEGFVSENDAVDGGGVLLSGASATFLNAIVSCNTAETDGGGLFTESSGASTFTNTVFFGNTSSISGTTRGSQAYIGTSTTFNLYNSIVQASTSVFALYGAGGSGTHTYNNVYNTPAAGYGGTLSAGTGAISSTSNFTSATCDGNVYNDDFSLRTTSGSINTGNPSSTYNDENGTRNDQGAYGGPNSVWSL